MYIVGGDSEQSDEDEENDYGGQEEGILLNTDSDIPPHTTSLLTPSNTITEIMNPLYNPVEQSEGYQPHTTLCHTYPEPNNTTSYVPSDSRGYKPQSQKESISPGAEPFSPTNSTHFLLSNS